MNNYQKYEKELIEIMGANENIAVSKETKKPSCCGDMNCNNCIFQGKGFCGDKIKEWLSAEYKEVIVLTDFEKEVLKRAKENGYKYITRDCNGVVKIFSGVPLKQEKNYIGNSPRTEYVELLASKNDFQFVKWEDEEPHSIEELLKEEWK